ncbi:FtsX-like permease family protein [Synechococcus sp. PCC 6312]|uniref:FtsX-like permease family protein n=1 Tax=Synechococcus sp. (strain ATCC 27167 / PCC 6312) TaxID=195253 RepID=UPI00029EF2F9|nr:FtsX-like permease family protein [Synechococcus sp. PCC 6312]AFY59448.1 ABC-type antimicrobial peptide transport system, permease component [Synechococcus sp. PCC 6312]
MVSIARKNLFEDLPRFMVAQAGIMFAVALVTVQTGLLEGFTKSSSLLIDGVKADLWVASKSMRFFDLTLPLPYSSVATVQQLPEVARSEPFIIQSGIWQRLSDRDIAPVRVIGFDPKGRLFQPWNVQSGSIADLERPNTAFIDRIDAAGLGITAVGQGATLNGQRLLVKGMTVGVRSLVASPYVFMSTENAHLYTNLVQIPGQLPLNSAPPLAPDSPISYVLVQVVPGTDLAALKTKLADAIPNSRILTQAEMSKITQVYWRNSTGVGFILGLGAIVGIVVGTVVVGQILYASVADHLKEYGTLKAMGASDYYLYRVILEQALWMAVLGYLPGLGLAMGLGSWTMQTRAIQILVSPTSAAVIFGVTVAMCSGAAVFAIQKVTRLDPAMVFKS